MEEFASLWSYQENIDELKQKLLYTTLELEAVKAQTDEKMKKNTESAKQLLQLLKIACQERDEARDQLQNLLNKIMPSNDQQIFNTTNPVVPNCFTSDQVQQHHQGPLMMPAKANSSITESNSLSEAYNHSSSPVDSFFDPISSPEFSNMKVETPFVQDYNQQNGGFSNGTESVKKVDQATLVMEGMIKGKTLPQKGNLLQAVQEAGPLLQTLLLAGPLPRWRNPPPLQALHMPPMVVAVDQMATTPKLDSGNPTKFIKSPMMMMMKQSQPYAEMACGSSSQMIANGGSVLSFGDVSYGSYFQGRMMGACPDDSNLSTIGKRQRLH